VWTTVVKDREATGPWAGMSLTTVGPSATRLYLNERNGEHHARAAVEPVAAPVADAGDCR